MKLGQLQTRMTAKEPVHLHANDLTQFGAPGQLTPAAAKPDEMPADVSEHRLDQLCALCVPSSSGNR